MEAGYRRIRPGILILEPINRLHIFIESVYTIFIYYFLRCLYLEKDKEYQYMKKTRAKVIVIRPQSSRTASRPFICDLQVL